VQVVPAVTSDTIFTVAPLHASDAVGAVKPSPANVDVEGHPDTEKSAPAAPIVGAVTSLTVIVWLTFPLVLPQRSLAFHVLVNVLVQVVPAVTSETILTVAPLHASDAVGAVKPSPANVDVAGHPDTEKSAPAAPIVGAVTSLTVIVWLTLPLVLPQPSEAFHVLVNVLVQVVPAVISDTIFTVAPLHASDAVGAVKPSPANVDVAGHPDTEKFAPAAPIVGAVTSLTVIVWLTLPLVLPQQVS
jgi:hypothetical protein